MSRSPFSTDTLLAIRRDIQASESLLGLKGVILNVFAEVLERRALDAAGAPTGPGAGDTDPWDYEHLAAQLLRVLGAVQQARDMVRTHGGRVWASEMLDILGRSDRELLGEPIPNTFPSQPYDGVVYQGIGNETLEVLASGVEIDGTNFSMRMVLYCLADELLHRREAALPVPPGTVVMNRNDVKNIRMSIDAAIGGSPSAALPWASMILGNALGETTGA